MLAQLSEQGGSGMGTPTADDARLYLQLLDLTQHGLQVEARRWFFWEFAADSYDDLRERYPAGSRQRDLLFNVLGFYESTGVLVSRGLLNEDVFFDAPFGFELLWERIRGILPAWQEAGGPAVWENVRWLGERFDAWREHVWRPKVEAVPPDGPFPLGS